MNVGSDAHAWAAPTESDKQLRGVEVDKDHSVLLGECIELGKSLNIFFGHREIGID